MPANPLRFVAVRSRERRTAALLLLVIAGGAVALALVNPSEHSALPACPTWRFLGLHCPGCGSTRATHWLLNGRLDLAWRFNPLLVAIGVPLGIFLVVSLASSAVFGARPTLRVPARIGYAAAILLVLYMAVRNLPVEGLAWLRPPVAASADAGPVAHLGPSPRRCYPLALGREGPDGRSAEVRPRASSSDG